LTLTQSDKKPLNPLIAAGAMTLFAHVLTKSDQLSKIVQYLEKFSQVAGQRMNTSMATYISMKRFADKDHTLAYWLRTSGVLNREMDVQAMLDFYFQINSLEVNPAIAAVLAATIANNGVCPSTKEKCFDSKYAKKVTSMMLNYGMNDLSDKYLELGFPSKCGVSGGVVVVVPKVFGLSLFSPALDSKGIPAKSHEFCKLLAQRVPALSNYKL